MRTATKIYKNDSNKKIDDAINFLRNVKTERKENHKFLSDVLRSHIDDKLTLRGLARSIGIAPSYLSEAIRGKRYFSDESILKIKAWLKKN